MNGVTPLSSSKRKFKNSSEIDDNADDIGVVVVVVGCGEDGDNDEKEDDDDEEQVADNDE